MYKIAPEYVKKQGFFVRKTLVFLINSAYFTPFLRLILRYFSPKTRLITAISG